MTVGEVDLRWGATDEQAADSKVLGRRGTAWDVRGVGNVYPETLA